MAEIPRNHIMLEAGEPGLNIHPAYTLLQTALLFSFIRNRTTGQTVLGLGVFQVRRQWGGLGAGHYLWAFSVQLLPGPRNTRAKQKAAAARQDARLTWGCIMPPACNPVLVDMHENTSFHPMLYFPNYSRALALQRCGCFHLLPPPFYIGFLSLCLKADGYSFNFSSASFLASSWHCWGLPWSLTHLPKHLTVNQSSLKV